MVNEPTKHICGQCKWIWYSRVIQPIKCPNCQSKYWEVGGLFEAPIKSKEVTFE